MSQYKETEGIKMHCCLPNRIYKRKEVDRKANKISSYAEQAKQDCNIEYILTTTLVSPPDFLFIHFSKVWFTFMSNAITQILRQWYPLSNFFYLTYPLWGQNKRKHSIHLSFVYFVIKSVLLYHDSCSRILS